MRLKELRIKKGWSLLELSLLVGVSDQTISNWEKGATEPDINSIKKLASFFKVTTDYLLEQDNDEAYVLDIFKKLEYLNKDELLDVTKSMITNLLGNLSHSENTNNKKTKKK